MAGIATAGAGFLFLALGALNAQFSPSNAVEVSFGPVGWWTDTRLALSSEVEPEQLTGITAARVATKPMIFESATRKLSPVMSASRAPLQTIFKGAHPTRAASTRVTATPAEATAAEVSALGRLYSGIHQNFYLALNIQDTTITVTDQVTTRTAQANVRPKKAVVALAKPKAARATSKAPTIVPVTAVASAGVQQNMRPRQILVDRLTESRAAPITKAVVVNRGAQRPSVPLAVPRGLVAEGAEPTESASAQLVSQEGPTAPVLAKRELSRGPSPTNTAPDYSVNPPPSVQKQSTTSLPTAASGVDYSLASQKTQALTPDAQTVLPVEAFAWSVTINGAIKKVLSFEGARSKSQHLGPARVEWAAFSAPGYRPTLTQGSVQAPPLLSENSVLTLAAASRVVAQTDMGLVFGKVPSGYSLRISGRAESPIYLSDTGVSVAADSAAEKYFLFLNVAPGAQLLYLDAGHGQTSNSTRGPLSAAIAVPVLAGTSSFIALERPVQTEIHGTVFDASSGTPSPLRGVQVRVLGQSAATALTGARGTFRISGAWILQGHPLYLETEAKEGFTHRYKMTPSQGQPLSLFRMSQSQIRGWTDQLEGGLSTLSGMVIGAVSSEIIQSASGEIQVSIRSSQGSSAINPEAYALDASDGLQDSGSLTKTQTRFIGVQVPEGPTVIALKNRDKQTVWSDLVVASPGVVNVVGP